MTQTVPNGKKPTIPSLTILLENLKADIFQQLNCVKIGTIKEFYPVLQTVDVQIAYSQITSETLDGVRTLAEFPLLVNVPVYFQSGGGFTMTFPISEGDECLLLFNDRQIDNWVLSGSGKPPSIERAHDLSDAFALVGIRNNTRLLANVSTSTAQLRSDDGSTYVEVAGSGIVNIVAPGGINFTTPLLTVSGDVVAGVETISLVHHVHSGVQSGGSNTGEPVV